MKQPTGSYQQQAHIPEQPKPQAQNIGYQSFPAQQTMQMTPISKPGKDAPTSWAGRAFKALDSENRGYLFKHELLNQIKKGGVYTHHQL